MPHNFINTYITARIAHGDLLEIDKQLSDGRSLDAQWLLLIKQSLLSVANIADMEASVQSIYKSNPEVSVEYKKWAKQFDFAKYVRNIYVGHTDPALVEKAVEWKPELRTLIYKDEDQATFVVNLALLETALNTYVDAQEKHLLFEGDTDLMYPPDWKRFLIFLTEIVRGGLAFLKSLLTAARDNLPEPPQDADLMLLYMRAGQTTFKRIKKGR